MKLVFSLVLAALVLCAGCAVKGSGDTTLGTPGTGQVTVGGSCGTSCTLPK